MLPPNSRKNEDKGLEEQAYRALDNSAVAVTDELRGDTPCHHVAVALDYR